MTEVRIFGRHALAVPIEIDGRRIAEIGVRQATDADRAVVAAEVIARRDPLPKFAHMAVAMEILSDEPKALLALGPEDFLAVAELVTASMEEGK